MKSRVHFVVQPRLMSLPDSARYLGVSEWSLRSWMEDGLIEPVNLPSVRKTQEKNRRLIFDRLDLEAFADARRRS